MNLSIIALSVFYFYITAKTESNYTKRQVLILIFHRLHVLIPENQKKRSRTFVKGSFHNTSDYYFFIIKSALIFYN